MASSLRQSPVLVLFLVVAGTATVLPVDARGQLGGGIAPPPTGARTVTPIAPTPLPVAALFPAHARGPQLGNVNAPATVGAGGELDISVTVGSPVAPGAMVSGCIVRFGDREEVTPVAGSAANPRRVRFLAAQPGPIALTLVPYTYLTAAGEITNDPRGAKRIYGRAQTRTVQVTVEQPERRANVRGTIAGDRLTLPAVVERYVASADGNTLYAVTGAAGQPWHVARWDRSTGTETARIALASFYKQAASPEARLVLDGARGRLHVVVRTHDGKLVAVQLDAATLAVSRVVPIEAVRASVPNQPNASTTVDDAPQHLLVNPDGTHLHVFGRGQNPYNAARRGTHYVVRLTPGDPAGAVFLGDVANVPAPAQSWGYGQLAPLWVPGAARAVLLPANVDGSSPGALEGVLGGPLAPTRALATVRASGPGLVGITGGRLYYWSGNGLKSVPANDLAAEPVAAALPANVDALAAAIVGSKVVVGGSGGIAVHDAATGRASALDASLVRSGSNPISVRGLSATQRPGEALVYLLESSVPAGGGLVQPRASSFVRFTLPN